MANTATELHSICKIENKEDTKHTIKSSRHSAVRKQTYVKKTIFD